MLLIQTLEQMGLNYSCTVTQAIMLIFCSQHCFNSIWVWQAGLLYYPSQSFCQYQYICIHILFTSTNIPCLTDYRYSARYFEWYPCIYHIFIDTANMQVANTNIKIWFTYTNASLCICISQTLSATDPTLKNIYLAWN